MKIYQLCQLAAFITGLIAFKVIRPAFLRTIVLLLALTVVSEIILVPYVKSHHLFNRNIIYNFFSFFDMLVWYSVFYKILEEYSVGKWVNITAVITFIWTAKEMTGFNGWHYIHPDSMRFYSFAIIVFSVIYLYQSFKKEFHPVYTDPFFWICSACIMYHSLTLIKFTTLPQTTFWNLKYADEISSAINNFINLCYYSLLSATFISCFYKRPQHQEV